MNHAHRFQFLFNIYLGYRSRCTCVLQLWLVLTACLTRGRGPLTVGGPGSLNLLNLPLLRHCRDGIRTFPRTSPILPSPDISQGQNPPDISPHWSVTQLMSMVHWPLTAHVHKTCRFDQSGSWDVETAYSLIIVAPEPEQSSDASPLGWWKFRFERTFPCPFESLPMSVYLKVHCGLIKDAQEIA